MKKKDLKRQRGNPDLCHEIREWKNVTREKRKWTTTEYLLHSIIDL